MNIAGKKVHRKGYQSWKCLYGFDEGKVGEMICGENLLWLRHSWQTRGWSLKCQWTDLNRKDPFYTNDFEMEYINSWSLEWY